MRNSDHPSQAASSRAQFHVWIQGKVQGVSFRATLLEQVGSSSEEIHGWVQNLPDGQVEALFQGPSDLLQDLLNWCQNGPPDARVDKVIVQEEPLSASEGPFRIKR